MTTHHFIALNRILDNGRSPNEIVAWRNKQPLLLKDFRALTLTIIDAIQYSPSERWALCFNDSYYFAASLMALFYCGKTPVIPGHLRQALLEEQAEEYDALLTDLALSLDCPTVNLTKLKPASLPEGALPVWPQQKALILYTSGSTGKPKAIVKPIDLLALESQILIDRFGSELAGSRIVSTVSHQHLYGLTFRIFLPLLAGLPFDCDIVEYHEQLQNYPSDGITLIASPAFLKRLDPNLPPLSCRLVFSAGGPLDFEVAQRTQQSLNALPQEIYGTSETGVIATRAQRTKNQIWSAFSGITVSQRADKTIKIFSPLFTDQRYEAIGDIIELEAGGFHLAGRKDRIVKIEEKRISLTEIEQRLCQQPEIDEAAVVTLEQDNRTIIGAVIVLSAYGRQQQQSGELMMTRRLRQTLRHWLEPVALPKRWRIIDIIPHNSQGKRSYIELQELFL
jgi:acyl-coenzyme A synthetase/AMP-(fatty) acid ligase